MKLRSLLPVISLWIVWMLLACNLPYSLLAAPDDDAVPTDSLMPGEVGGGILAPDASPGQADVPTEQPCGYIWASQPLPEVSHEIQIMLEEAGVENARVNAEAFGENCVQADGQVVRFLVMQTDIRILLGVESISDVESLGELAAHVLPVLLGIPQQDLPGPNEGYIGLQFSDSTGQVLNIWLPKQTIRDVMKNQLDGSALIEKLQQK